MEIDAVVDVLRQVDLFEGVEDAALRALSGSGRVIALPSNEYVVRQGEFGDSFFVVLRGELAVEVFGEDGRIQPVARLVPRHYFGELAMLGHGERTESVRSATPAKLLELREAPFQGALKKHKKVRTRIEDIYNRNAISAFIRQSRYFRDLDEATQRDLARACTLHTYSKDQLITAEGEEAKAVYIVRAGFVRVSRKVDGAGQDEILAYLGAEDFFGDQELAESRDQYGATVVALEPVQCIAVPAQAFTKLNEEHPEIFVEFRRYQLSRFQGRSVLSRSKTSLAFVKDVLESGLGQARSALIINLDACVRCGNCVQACDDLHGYSRIARRGRKMTRRIDLEKSAHESLYFPTSCLQCSTPECMVGCPTGAISRDPGGEVFIRDTCIGCGSCARNCDFGNISMARPRHEVDFSLFDMVLGRQPQIVPHAENGTPDLVAVKCDVCFQRDHAACVYNCPTQAILRVDPRSYFAELAHIAPRATHVEPGAAPAKTTLHRPRRWIDGFLQILAALGSVAGGWYLWKELEPSSWIGIGWYAGIAGAALMLLLGLMGVRKRLRTARLGSLSRWMRAHAVLGGLFYGVVLFHAGYQATSVLTATLLAMITLVVLVGAGGQIANAFIPWLLARTEDESLLPEDVVDRMRTGLAANEELLLSLEDEARMRVEERVPRLAKGVWRMFLDGVSPKKLPALLEHRARLWPALEESEHAVALRVAENTIIHRMFIVRRALEVFMISWVPLHLVASCIAVLLLIGHLLTVVLW